MTVHGMFFLSSDFYDVIRKIGGTWSDTKERPIVCLIKSSENEHLYWAIPVGNWDHRNEEAKKRIMSYINGDKRKIQSCFYHLGKTTVKSIFFKLLPDFGCFFSYGLCWLYIPDLFLSNYKILRDLWIFYKISSHCFWLISAVSFVFLSGAIFKEKL